MKTRTTPAPAELADRSVQLLACILFAVALLFSLSVAEFFASDSIAELLDIAAKVLAVAVIGSVAFMFVWKIRGSSSGMRERYLAEDGFLQVAFEKAMAKSWMFSFLILVTLQALDNLVLEPLPVIPLEVVVQSVLALMLFLMSIAFLLLTRSQNHEE